MDHFTFPDFLFAIQSYGITTLTIAPPVAVLLAKSHLVDQYDLSSVQRVISGAAPLSGDTALAVEEILDPSGTRNVRACDVRSGTDNVGTRMLLAVPIDDENYQGKVCLHSEDDSHGDTNDRDIRDVRAFEKSGF